MTYSFTPEARNDLADAADFYESQRDGLGLEFAVDVGLAIAAVLDAPSRWPEIRPGFRKYRLNRFPFALVYRVAAVNRIDIFAVFDLRRRPDSWRR